MPESVPSPRNLFPDPTAFGRRPLPPDLGAAPPDAASRARWRAAQLHWVVAFAVRTELKSARRAKSSLADSIGWRRERLSRLLTGHARMTPEDMFLLLEAIGADWMAVARGVPQSAAANRRQQLTTIQWFLKTQLSRTEQQLRGEPEAGSSSPQRARPTPR
ncbi:MULTISPECIES: helix-turn-helix domain-containing protein [Microbacterium]|uniref:helix-turn-helix domain-containing protein n=1 Tax=Microbacterium TaxID=33882 RepID=UPI00344CB72C